MRGLRIRVQQSDLMVEMIRALGAEPVELPYGQVATGLSTRLIDGAENNWPSYVTAGHYKVAPLLHPDRAHDGPGDRDHVAARLGRACRPKTGRSSATPRAKSSALHARAMERAGRALARNRREAAGDTVIADFDRKPFEAATAGDLRQDA